MIIPRPAEYTAHSGEFVLGPALNLAAGPGAERPAELLAAYLGADRPRTDAGPAVALRLDDGAHDHPHGYDLLITPDAGDARGAERSRALQRCADAAAAASGAGVVGRRPPTSLPPTGDGRPATCATRPGWPGAA